MATYLERYAEVAKRLFSTAGQEAVHALSPELFFGVVFENDRPEHQLLGATRLIWGRVQIAAAAANFSTARIAVPAGVSVVTVIQGMVVFNNNLNVQQVSAAQAGFAATGVVGFRDSRNRGNPSSGWGGRQNAAQICTAPQYLLGNSGVTLQRVDLVCTPGGAPYYFEPSAVNVACDFGWFGYERVLDSHEFDATVV